MVGLAKGRAEAMSLTLSLVQKLTTNNNSQRPQGGIPQQKDTSPWQQDAIRHRPKPVIGMP